MSGHVAGVDIAAPAEAVWRALVEPERIARWMNGARVETRWQVGAEIALHVELEGRAYVDRGTVTVFDPPRVLEYRHWSAISGRPDTPDARTRIRFELEPLADGTRLTVTHDGMQTDVEAKHVAFFWNVAVLALGDVVLGRR